MAVYTKISSSKLDDLLQNYNIGNCIDLISIEEGVENSNYFLVTEEKKYVFTVYEKRIREEDLPFFLQLMQHLSQKGFPCPVPIKNKQGEFLSQILDKKCVIVSFLEGKGVKKIHNYHLQELGIYLAKMHLSTICLLYTSDAADES